MGIKRSQLFSDMDREREDAVDSELGIMSTVSGNPDEKRELALRRLGLAPDAGQPLQVNDGSERQNAIDSELGIMSTVSGSPSEKRELAIRRLGLSPDPGQNDGTGGSGEPDFDTPDFAKDAAEQQSPTSSFLSQIAPQKAAPAPKSPAAQAPPDFTLHAPPSAPSTSAADNLKGDRVSQALYSAFTRKPLDDSFFEKPADLAMRQEELDQRKSHNDYLKDQLRSKYAAKGVSVDPEDNNAASPQSNMAQSAVLGSKTLAPIVERMGGEAAIRKMSKNQIQSIFPAKQFSPLLTGEFREGNKIPVEDAKEGNRETLEGKKQEGRVELAGHADTRAANALEAATVARKEKMDRDADKMAIALGNKLPPQTREVFDAGKRIDGLVKELGGEGNLEGIGLISGAFPNPIMEKKSIQLRHEIMNLINTYGHSNFGGALTKDEIGRLNKAVGDISAWRSETEVLDGVRLIRELYASRGNQVLGNAPSYIKDRISANNAEPIPELYGSTPTGPAAPAPPSQPTATATATASTIRRPAQKAPAPDTAVKSPKRGAAYATSIVKDGKRYFIDAKNKIVDWIEEAAGGQ